MDTLNKLKTEFLSELNVQYKNLINFLQMLPVNQQFKNYGFMNLDQGIMWFHKGIEILQIENKKAEIPPQNSVENSQIKVLDELKVEEPPTVQ